MTTIINPPPVTKESGGGIGLIIGIIVLIIFVYLFFVYGLPFLQQMMPQAPQINVPDKIDININQTK